MLMGCAVAAQAAPPRETRRLTFYDPVTKLPVDLNLPDPPLRVMKRAPPTADAEVQRESEHVATAKAKADAEPKVEAAAKAKAEAEAGAM